MAGGSASALSTPEDALRTITQAQRTGPGTGRNIVEQPVASDTAQPVGSVTAATPLVGLVWLVHANPGIVTEPRKRRGQGA
jgi:hypothetical protein